MVLKSPCRRRVAVGITPHGSHRSRCARQTHWVRHGVGSLSLNTTRRFRGDTPLRFGMLGADPTPRARRSAPFAPRGPGRARCPAPGMARPLVNLGDGAASGRAKPSRLASQQEFAHRGLGVVVGARRPGEAIGVSHTDPARGQVHRGGDQVHGLVKHPDVFQG